MRILICNQANYDNLWFLNYFCDPHLKKKPSLLKISIEKHYTRYLLSSRNLVPRFLANIWFLKYFKSLYFSKNLILWKYNVVHYKHFFRDQNNLGIPINQTCSESQFFMKSQVKTFQIPSHDFDLLTCFIFLNFILI